VFDLLCVQNTSVACFLSMQLHNDKTLQHFTVLCVCLYVVFLAFHHFLNNEAQEMDGQLKCQLFYIVYVVVNAQIVSLPGMTLL